MEEVPCRMPLGGVFYRPELSRPFDRVFQMKMPGARPGIQFYQREPKLRDDLFITQRTPLPFVQSRAMHMAMPMPPPMHKVASPFLAPRFSIPGHSLTSARAPQPPAR